MGDPDEINKENQDEYLIVSEERARPRITVDEGIFDRPIRDMPYHPPRCIQPTGNLAEAAE